MGGRTTHQRTCKGKTTITDGYNVRYIFPDEPIPDGWRKGRAGPF